MTTAFLYDGEAVLLEKQGTTTTATYTYGNALVRKDGEYPLFDGLGSERTVTNSSGTVTGTLTLSAFGQAVASTGSSSDPYMFGATSRYRNDGDVGLTLVGCRYYDAQVGRFITRDTVLTEKPYAYCEHDPVNGVDPTGHDNQPNGGGSGGSGGSGSGSGSGSGGQGQGNKQPKQPKIVISYTGTIQRYITTANVGYKYLTGNGGYAMVGVTGQVVNGHATVTGMTISGEIPLK